jgi:Lrp/AsnC family transcriptional regulator, regulator for asnA, asnC and gidA
MNADTLDKNIVAILNNDGHISNKDIAARLKISEGTVRNRIRKLTASGRLRIAGLINPDHSPDKQLMLLGVNIACSRNLAAKAAEIARLEGVQSAYITAGRYDIVAEVWIDTKGGLIRFLSQTLARVTGINSTESFLIMKSFNKWIAQPDL